MLLICAAVLSGLVAVIAAMFGEGDFFAVGLILCAICSVPGVYLWRWGGRVIRLKYRNVSCW
jgi:hypothetical protein